MKPGRSLVHPSVRDFEGPAFLAKGFRPFFFLASAYAALSLPLWVLSLSGHLAVNTRFIAPYWHAHEMVFGFALAVIAGFLLTAVANWTGRETATGLPLALLALLWIAGRVAVLAGDLLPGRLAAGIDLAFIPSLAIALARPIINTKNRRNYGFLGLLALLFSANSMMHAGALAKGSRLGVELVVVMIVVITGRVLPMFTKNTTRLEHIRSHPLLDRAAIGATVLLALADVGGVDETWTDRLALVAGIFVLARMLHWGGRHTLRHPLLWILHAACGFVGLGLLLRFFVPWSPSTWLHALTAGGIGLATLGMMARVALGHTGRMLVPPKLVVVAFWLCLLAALIRVFGPLAGSAIYLPAMILSGSAFALAFALYLVAYAPMLSAVRVDGRPG